MKEKFLPIGTVCMLKNGKLPVMIMGYLSKGQQDNKRYDYFGNIYPIGITDIRYYAEFNHDQIEHILYMGFENKVFDAFNGTLKIIDEGKDVQNKLKIYSEELLKNNIEDYLNKNEKSGE